MVQYTEKLSPLVLQRNQKFSDIATRKKEIFDKTFANYQMNLQQ